MTARENHALRLQLGIVGLSAVVALSLTAGLACGSKQQPTTKQSTSTFARFVSSQYKFSLSYPAHYQSGDIPANRRPSDAVYGRAWATGKQSSPVGLWVFVFPRSMWGNLGARDMLDSMRKRLSAGKGDAGQTYVKLRAAGLTTVAGLPTAYWESSYTYNGAARVERVNFVLGREFIYDIHYSTAPNDFSAYTKQLDQIVSSLGVMP